MVEVAVRVVRVVVVVVVGGTRYICERLDCPQSMAIGIETIPSSNSLMKSGQVTWQRRGAHIDHHQWNIQQNQQKQWLLITNQFMNDTRRRLVVNGGGAEQEELVIGDLILFLNRTIFWKKIGFGIMQNSHGTRGGVKGKVSLSLSLIFSSLHVCVYVCVCYYSICVC